MERALNIISFDVPFPPNYGGVVDVFYKLKALHALGIKIHLHCFEYGRGEQSELKKYCESVTYYKRDQRKTKLFDKLPFVVSTRKNRTLLRNLQANNYPILIEGLHNGWYLKELQGTTRKIVMRTHNVEHDYYKGLAKVERSIFKKQFFNSEASKLKKFESILSDADVLLAISPNDFDHFESRYHNAKYIPAFHSGEEVTSKPGKGYYSLYHGNLSVGENNEAAMYLVKQVFAGSAHRLIIAGSNPSQELRKEVEQYPNIELMADIEFTELEELIANAHINVLPTFQPTGIKLKMLSALYKGRFCLVNNFMVDNTGLEEACVLADNPEAMKNAIDELMEKSFTEEDLEIRERVLKTSFNNLENAKTIVESVYN